MAPPAGLRTTSSSWSKRQPTRESFSLLNAPAAACTIAGGSADDRGDCPRRVYLTHCATPSVNDCSLRISLKKSENDLARNSRVCAARGVEDVGWPREPMTPVAETNQRVSCLPPNESRRSPPMAARIVVEVEKSPFSTVSAHSGRPQQRLWTTKLAESRSVPTRPH
jgi:hypothetical protein